MDIPFEVKWAVEHRDGGRQTGTLTIWAPNERTARLRARENVFARCGEHASQLVAKPEEESR